MRRARCPGVRGRPDVRDGGGSLLSSVAVFPDIRALGPDFWAGPDVRAGRAGCPGSGSEEHRVERSNPGQKFGGICG